MLKIKQNKRKWFNLLKLISLLAILYLLYSQLSRIEDDSWRQLHLTDFFGLSFGLLLVFLNIYVAYFQWRLTLKVIAPKTDTSTRVNSFFAGLVTGMLTPNMVGNFIGRLYYFPRNNRVSIILFTLLTNSAQFIATLLFGWFAIVIAGNLYIPNSELYFSLWLGIVVIVSFLFYFFIDNFLARLKKREYFNEFKKLLKQNSYYRLSILGLSVLRFLVFTSQFSLLLLAFGEKLSLIHIMGIWQVYLLTMIFPSIILGKIGIRESVALFVLTDLGVNEYSVLFTSLIIWFVNSLLPALIGVLITKGKTSNG